MFIAVLIAFVLRQWVVEVNYAVTDAVSPEVPRGAYVAVLKLAHRFTAGDIIVYRRDNVNVLAASAQSNADGNLLMVRRDKKPSQPIPLASVVGKVIFNTRPGILALRSPATGRASGPSRSPVAEALEESGRSGTPVPDAARSPHDVRHGRLTYRKPNRPKTCKPTLIRHENWSASDSTRRRWTASCGFTSTPWSTIRA